MIEIGAIVSLILWIVGPPIGIVFRIWTPNRFFWFHILGSIPFLGLLAVQLFLDDQAILIIPLAMILVPILISLASMAAKKLARDPWRRLYRVKLDADDTESEK